MIAKSGGRFSGKIMFKPQNVNLDAI